MATHRPEDNQRKEYSGTDLAMETVLRDPIAQFAQWYKEAEQVENQEANAMSVSTVSPEGLPSSRIVLLKSYGVDGFTFYTNYGSDKGKELDGSGQAAILFWWPKLARQVRIEGTVTRTSREDSEEYFASRPRGSQIGAWASRQSDVIKSRQDLLDEFLRIDGEYRDRKVPCPAWWGGYCLTPARIEFWQGQENRLHDRLVFVRTDDESWSIKRLSP